MTSTRTVRRNLGLIHRFVPDSLFKRIQDPRNTRGRRWKKAALLLKTVMVGLLSGCRGLLDVEELTRAMPTSTRGQLGLKRRVPDTTLREFLCRLDVDSLKELVETVGYDAYRRKALRPLPGFPFGVLSMDGKYPSVKDTGQHRYLQVQHDEDGRVTHGLLRTITVTLATGVGRPILGAVPVPKETNESGAFETAFLRMVEVYGRLFRLVMYDAGAASLDNATAVVEKNKDYLFQIADPRWIMVQTIDLLMREKPYLFRDEQLISSKRRVVRELAMIPISPEGKCITVWSHVKTAFKLRSTTYENGTMTSSDIRYYVSSIEPSELPPSKWLELIVLRWGVETCHQILDTAFEEDDHPWISQNANGALAVMLLRRVAYTILTLYKSVTLRSEDNHLIPWKKLMGFLKDALKWPNPIGEDFRPRTFAVPPAFIE